MIIALSGMVLIPTQSFSLLTEQSPEELYRSHHTIVIGKIISSEIISQRETLYETKVIESIKNSQQNEIISAVGNGIDCSKVVVLCERSSIDRVFDVGDTVILYLNYGLDNFEVSPYSRTISPDEDVVTSEFARPGWYYHLLIGGGIIGIFVILGVILFWRKKRK